LTLETSAFFLVVAFLAAGLAAGLGATFLPFVARLVATSFLAVLAFAGALRAAGLAAAALLAFGLEAGLALTARFAVFAEARFAEVRAVDRRKPFVRLLLILRLISKGCSVILSSHWIAAQLNTASRLNQLAQPFAGDLARL
jgi:hypothetical protein